MPTSSSEASTYKSTAFHGFDGAASEEELEIDDGKFPKERYKPIQKLGEGVSGTVYLGRDRLLGKKVAVKVLRTRDADALIQFQNEARTTSKLNHPNIVRVLDFGIASDGIPFMVIDYVDGRSLEDYIKENGGMDFDSVLTIFDKLADALSYAHSANVLHRDLKPSNILISFEDQEINVHLIDFGVAKMQEHLRTTMTNGTTLVGTPAYMSPDQALGHSFDRRSDIYSLGCILFEAITGEQPFIASSPLETISMHAHEEAPSILSYVDESEAALGLDKIVATCMAKDPRLRYQNATAFKRALNTVPRSGDNNESGSVEPALTNRTKRAALPLVLASIAFALVAFGATFVYVLEPAEQIHTNKKVLLDSSFRDSMHPTVKVDVVDVFTPRGDVSVTYKRGIPAIRAQGISDAELKDALMRYPSTNDISLDHSRVTNTGFKALKNHQINNLVIEHQQLSFRQLKAISKIDSLRILVLHNCTGSFLNNLSLLDSSGQLVHLGLYDTPSVSNTTLAEISKIRSIELLEMPMLKDCEHLDFRVLTALPNLKILRIDFSDFSDKNIEEIAGAKHLAQLFMARSAVSDRSLNRLAAMHLEKLSIEGCPGMTEEGIKMFKSKSPKTELVSMTSTLNSRAQTAEPLTQLVE